MAGLFKYFHRESQQKKVFPDSINFFVFSISRALGVENVKIHGTSNPPSRGRSLGKITIFQILLANFK